MGCTLTPPCAYEWTVRMRRRCGLMSNYFDHSLFALHYQTKSCEPFFNIITVTVECSSNSSCIHVRRHYCWIAHCTSDHFCWYPIKRFLDSQIQNTSLLFTLLHLPRSFLIHPNTKLHAVYLYLLTNSVFKDLFSHFLGIPLYKQYSIMTFVNYDS